MPTKMKEDTGFHLYKREKLHKQKDLRVFDFYCDNFLELPDKMAEKTGFYVHPNQIFSISMHAVEGLSGTELHVTLILHGFAAPKSKKKQKK